MTNTNFQMIRLRLYDFGVIELDYFKFYPVKE